MNDRDVDDVIVKFFGENEELSDEQARRLSEWVASDAAHADALVELIMLESDVRQILRNEQLQGVLGVLKEPSASPTSSPQAQSRWMYPMLAAAIACSLALAPILNLRKFTSDGPSAEPVAEQPAAPAHVVATLSEMRDCRWEGAERVLSCGHLFTVGATLRLSSGVAQITFETGAASIVEAPAEFTLRENAMELVRGRVSAVVPESASGFTVLTPSSEVIDLGTEFGVSVDDKGGSQVHVFSGEVVTRSRNAAGEAVGESVFVTTNNAVQYGPGTEQYKRLVANENAFATMLADERSAQDSFVPPVGGALSLWLTSEQWIVDQQQRVTVWRDAQSSENLVPDNALQADPNARPLVVEDAINGHAAVRFDGLDDFLVTTPFHSGNNQTVAFVACIHGTGEGSPDQPHQAPQILNYNGPPQLDAGWYAAPNILEIVAKSDEHSRIFVNPYVYMGWRGRKPNAPVFVGDLSTASNESRLSSRPALGQPFVAVYVYDHEANHAELWINNQSAGSENAPAAISLTSRKVIGRHGGWEWNFSGDLAELLIYDRGLGESEVTTLSESLAAKFGIELPE